MVVENLDSEKMMWRENDVACSAITRPEDLRIFLTFPINCIRTVVKWGLDKVVSSNSGSHPVYLGDLIFTDFP